MQMGKEIEIVPIGSDVRKFPPQGDFIERDVVDPDMHWGSGLIGDDKEDILARLQTRSMRQIIDKALE